MISVRSGNSGMLVRVVGMLLALLGASAAAQVKGVKHVVVIGCDGMGSVAFLETNAPTMHRLMREGAYTLKARSVMPTVSSPNWASMIMGAGPEQHGVTSNDWQTNKYEIAPIEAGPEGMFPTIFGVLHQQRPEATLVCVHDWSDFGRLLERSAVNYITNVKSSPLTSSHVIEQIKLKKPTFTFIHFDDVDHAGHSFGWKSWQYYKAVDMIDTLIGDVVQAVADAGMKDSTLILITADHGGMGTKHGGNSMDELLIPWIVHGPGVVPGRVLESPINTYDTAATLAYIFGVKPPKVWIGRPVVEAFGRRR